MSGGGGTYWYYWYLNDSLVSTTSKTYTIPSTAKAGDVIRVEVTDNTTLNSASDSVIVGATTELALESVEGAAEDANTNTYNVVIAYFNQPVENLAAGDIQIRKVSDDQLFAVESVSLSSDGMKATITLANSSSAGASVVGLTPNVDYNMIVTSEDGTASKEFYIPMVASDVSVLGINPSAGKFTIADPLTAVTYRATELTVPADMDVDYEYLLGRTVTVKYDKSNLITSLNIYDEDVVYGAFKVNNTAAAGDGNIEDLLTGEKYTSQDFITAASEIHTTVRLNRAANGAVTPVQADGTTADTIAALDATTFDKAAPVGAYADGTEIAYAKLVLNSNGTVKVMVTEPTWGATATPNQTNNVLVSAVHGTTVLGGTTEVDLKNYVIVEDGFTIDTDDIEEGDVVFYNTGHKYAEVYTVAETDELEAVYNNRFAFQGKTYDEANAVGNIQYRSRYIKSGGGLTNVDDDYMTSLASSGEDITVYFDRAGEPVYVTGTLGEVKTTTEKVVLTAAPASYNQSLTNYLRLKGWNGKETKTYDIDVSGLTSVTIANGTTYSVGYNTAGTKTATEGGFFGAKTGGAAYAAFTGAGDFICQFTDAPTNTAARDILNVDAGIARWDYVELTLDDSGKVIGLNIEDVTGEPATAALTDGLKTITGATTGVAYQISASTPIYVYTADGNVSKMNYEDFSGTVAAANVNLYSYDEKNVKAIVVLNTNIIGGQNVYSVEGVVANVERNAGTNNYISELTIVSGNGFSTDTEDYTTTYTKFAKEITNAGIAKGDIVTLQVAADGETVNEIAENGDDGTGAIVTTGAGSAAAEHVNDGILVAQDINLVSNEKQTFRATFSANDLAFATTTAPTIVEFKDGAIAALDFATFITETEKYAVSLSMLNGSTAYVDTVVVTAATARTASTTAYTAAKTAIDKIAATDLAINTVSAATENTGAKAKAAVKTGIEAKNLAAIDAALDGSETITDTADTCSVGDAAATAAGTTVTSIVTVSLNGYSKTFTVLSTLVA